MHMGTIHGNMISPRVSARFSARLLAGVSDRIICMTPGETLSETRFFTRGTTSSLFLNAPTHLPKSLESVGFIATLRCAKPVKLSRLYFYLLT